MKKIFLILMLMGNLTSGLAQQKMTFQKACHPDDVKHYDTQTLRDRFVMEKVMAADESFYFRWSNARHEGTEAGNRSSAPC